MYGLFKNSSVEIAVRHCCLLLLVRAVIQKRQMDGFEVNTQQVYLDSFVQETYSYKK